MGLAKFLRAYLKLMDWLDNLVKWITSPLCAAIVIVIAIQVFTRFIGFIKSPPWTEELARYLMIAMAFLAASNGIKNWNNISVDFLTNKFSPRTQKIINIVIQVAALALMVFIAYICWKTFGKVGFRQKSSTLYIRMIIPQSALIIGSITMCLQLIGVIIRQFVKGDDNNA